jgi:hypothetical protein
MLTIPSVPTGNRLELVRLLGHGWVITDTTFEHDDPRCLVAYVERAPDGFEVVWVQAPMGTAYFATKDEIMQAAAVRCGGMATAA